ncbi:MAG: cytochrome c, partial [Flavobacteriaceae bacterium]
MKQVIHRKLSQSLLRFSLIILLAFSTSLSAQEGDPVKGKSLFNANCAACHQLDKKMTGPALRNVEQRLADDEGLDREWISAWIRNSAGVIKSGDAYANKIYNEYGGAAMTPMPQLTDEDINNI